MKKVVFFIALFSLSSIVMAQSNNEETDFIQSIFGMEKKAVVAEFIQLEGIQGTTFWAMYDEYEAKRKELGKERLSLLQKYADTYDSMDDNSTGELLTKMMSIQASNDKLISTYTKKMKKKVDVNTAAKFYQIEGYILSKVRSEILENIPLIGDR